ncbi:MAG: hypothetical protein ACFB50_12485 [Rubrobacteraceae bacterium]
MPPALTVLGGLLFLVLAVLFIFFVARGCVATQEATQVRKYVMGSNSLLTDSSNLGREKLQPLLQRAAEDPAQLDEPAVGQAVDEAQLLYQRALENREVPPEFEEANNYLVSTLGIRAAATERLQRAAGDNPEDFGEELSSTAGDYRTSDLIAIGHYFPASVGALKQADQQEDRNYLKEPRAFMDYEVLGVEAGAAAPQARGDPDALHDLRIAGVELAGQQLVQEGTVVLSGSQVPVFATTVTNGGEVAETDVPVEVVLDTRAGRQTKSKSIEKIEPGGGTATVRIGGFRPGELDETAGVTVEAGPVEYEEQTDDNTLAGWVTFGL